jgi:hypothetical protein
MLRLPARKVKPAAGNQSLIIGLLDTERLHFPSAACIRWATDPSLAESSPLPGDQDR